MPEFAIRASADEVATLLQQGRARDAAAHLETLRQGQPQVIREALDRFVAARAQAQLAALRQPGAVPITEAASVQPMLDRLARAGLPPWFPKSMETENLTQAQLHDVYASIVATRGNDVAHTALAGQDRVILGRIDIQPISLADVEDQAIAAQPLRVDSYPVGADRRPAPRQGQ